AATAARYWRPPLRRRSLPGLNEAKIINVTSTSHLVPVARVVPHRDSRRLAPAGGPPAGPGTQSASNTIVDLNSVSSNAPGWGHQLSLLVFFAPCLRNFE